MAYKTLFKPSLILTLRLNKTVISLSHHHPFRHSQPPFPSSALIQFQSHFLQQRELLTTPTYGALITPPSAKPLRVQKNATWTSRTRSSCGSAKWTRLRPRDQVVSTVTSVSPQCASNTYPQESLLRFCSQNFILLHFSSWVFFVIVFLIGQMLIVSFC